MPAFVDDGSHAAQHGGAFALHYTAWKERVLQVHFRSFPMGRLLRWEGEASLRAAFFNSLKARPCWSPQPCPGMAVGARLVCTAGNHVSSLRS